MNVDNTIKDQSYIYDAIVLGAGLGGALTALELSTKGFNVLLIEKEDSILPSKESEAYKPYIEEITKNKDIKFLPNTEVVQITKDINKLGYLITTKKQAVFKTRTFVNCTWENVAKLDQTAGLYAPNYKGPEIHKNQALEESQKILALGYISNPLSNSDMKLIYAVKNAEMIANILVWHCKIQNSINDILLPAEKKLFEIFQDNSIAKNLIKPLLYTVHDKLLQNEMKNRDFEMNKKEYCKSLINEIETHIKARATLKKILHAFDKKTLKDHRKNLFFQKQKPSKNNTKSNDDYEIQHIKQKF